MRPKFNKEEARLTTEVQDKAGKQEARQPWTHLLAGNMLGERPEAGTAASSLTCCHRCVQWSPAAPGVWSRYCRQVVSLELGTEGPPGGCPGRSPENPEALNTGGGDLSHGRALPVEAGEEMRSKTSLAQQRVARLPVALQLQQVQWADR